jgi:starch phosphorylase
LPPENPSKSIRTGGSVDALKQAFVDNLFYVQGRFMPIATPNDFYMALAYTVRDRILDRWIETSILYFPRRVHTKCYLSAECLPGPHLGLNLVNLGLYDEAEQAMMGWLDLENFSSRRKSPVSEAAAWALATCTWARWRRSVPAIGYGIRASSVSSGEIRDGWQVEVSDRLAWESWSSRPRSCSAWASATHRMVGARGRGLSTGFGVVEWRTTLLSSATLDGELPSPLESEAGESLTFAFNAGDYWRGRSESDSENLSKVLSQR